MSVMERALSSFRERGPLGRIRWAPAWYDLSERERSELYEESLLARKLEAALDGDGLSTTARAVLDRIAP